MREVIIMLCEKDVRFLNNCNYYELVIICDEIKKDSFNGATRKQDLLSHIINHYRLYESMECELILDDDIRSGCTCRKEKIEEIIHKHMELAKIFG